MHRMPLNAGAGMPLGKTGLGFRWREHGICRTPAVSGLAQWNPVRSKQILCIVCGGPITKNHRLGVLKQQTIVWLSWKSGVKESAGRAPSATCRGPSLTLCAFVFS